MTTQIAGNKKASLTGGFFVIYRILTLTNVPKRLHLLQLWNKVNAEKYYRFSLSMFL